MIALVRATPADIPFILATERGPGYEPLVGRWPQDEHRAAMADSNWLYFLGVDESGVARGFALLQDMNKRDGNQFLRRVAMTKAGGGFGRPFLTALIDWVFANADAHRLWLSVRDENARARHVYFSLGFVDEGPEQTPGSASTIMALQKQAWLSR